MKGVVVAPEPMAAEVGADVLRAGGNAFDAAVAAAFAQAVFNPFQCGLGGWGGATLYDAATGACEDLAFPARIGSRMRPDMWVDDIAGYTDVWHYALFEDRRNMIGYTAVMTPGTVAGLGELHRRHGSTAWAELLAPSIEWSDRGFAWPEYVAMYCRSPYLPDLPHPRDKYCATPAAAALFQRADGTMLERGDHYRNPDQAASLRAIAVNGPAELSTGALADVVAEDFERNGAFVTREDLATYRPRWSSPLEGSYRGLRVATATLPAGGIILLQMLKVLERFELRGLEHNGPEHGFLVSAALAWGGVTRFRHLSDPEHSEVPVDHLLSDDVADEVAARIRAGELPDAVTLDKPSGTSHLTIVDEQGNCVSLTHTLTSCSGVVVPGTGFTWNDCVALMDPRPGRPNSYVPGRARASALATTIVFADDAPWLVLGAPGGWSVTSGVLQSIVNIVDFGMTPTEAVVAPRFHSEGTPVFCELRVPQRTVRALRDRGVPLRQSLYHYHASFSRPQVVMITEDGYRAASDPRSDGGAAVHSTG
ncbi:MAG: gamma-glutamyltransferase [Thermoleophilia bacterium]|nr:gamma-glutamyltransferase [Thermoleophilia bacterium]MDH5333881.1 gamma-glutamyltransferase [Thermoleophilia bacterium]